MNKYYYILFLLILVSCKSNRSIINDHVAIEIYTFERDGKLAASAMPVVRADSDLNSYARRFEYLLINVSEIHLPENAEKRKKIWDVYPDTTKLKRRYLKEYTRDKKLIGYFETTSQAIIDTGFEGKLTYTEAELMEVASKFFYCDKVFPDTAVQSHICVGLNGTRDANWNKDYTLLEAFCYESIFNDLVKDSSQIEAPFHNQKKGACEKYRSSITSLDQYLLDVRNELFLRMKEDPVLQSVLLEYYEQNKNNLAFKMISEE